MTDGDKIEAVRRLINCHYNLTTNFEIDDEHNTIQIQLLLKLSHDFYKLVSHYKVLVTPGRFSFSSKTVGGCDYHITLKYTPAKGESLLSGVHRLWLPIIQSQYMPRDEYKELERYQAAWLLNDEAHQEKHFNEVYRCGLYLNQVLDLGYSDAMIALTAYFHDLFAWSRVNHHDLSGAFIEGTEDSMVSQLSPRDRQLVADACREHRASFKGDFSHEFSALMNSADRGFPGSSTGVLRRSVEYTKAVNKVSDSTAIEMAVMHIKDKFGTGGYARYPELYQKAFADALLQQQQAIDKMTLESARLSLTTNGV